MPRPFHVHLVAPSNEDSTYIKPLWAATLAAHTPEDVELSFRDDGLDSIDLERESDVSASRSQAGSEAKSGRRRPRSAPVFVRRTLTDATPERGPMSIGRRYCAIRYFGVNFITLPMCETLLEAPPPLVQ
jgi:hypothetical protein